MYVGKFSRNKRKHIQPGVLPFVLSDMGAQFTEKAQKRLPQIRVVCPEKRFHFSSAQTAAPQEDVGCVGVIANCRLPCGGRNTNGDFGTHSADAAGIQPHGADAKGQQSQRHNAKGQSAHGDYAQ